jgi:hypothetical protein
VAHPPALADVTVRRLARIPMHMCFIWVVPLESISQLSHVGNEGYGRRMAKTAFNEGRLPNGTEVMLRFKIKTVART